MMTAAGVGLSGGWETSYEGEVNAKGNVPCAVLGCVYELAVPDVAMGTIMSHSEIH